MVDYSKLRKKFPGKGPSKSDKARKIKAIAREYEQKKASLAAAAPLSKRGFPYYMTIIIGMLLVSGLAGSAIFKRGGIDIAGRNAKKATESVRNLAIALGRYRYHVGRFPSTEEGLEQLASKNVSARGWNGPYIRDLKPDPWKNEYIYTYNGESEPPTLYSKGPDGKAGTTDDIIASRPDFDAAFRDVSWTKDWVPMHLRDIVVAQNEKQKKALQEEVERILHPDIPAEGATPLRDGWEAAGPSAWRKSLSIPAKAAGRRIALSFTCLPGPWSVFFNGEKAGEGADGSDGFEIDATRFAKPGGRNTFEIRSSAPCVCTPSGAWIAGDAILRVEDPVARIVAGTLVTETLAISPGLAKMRLRYSTPSGSVTNDFECVSPALWTPARPFLQKGWLLGRLHHYAIRTTGLSPDGSFLLNGEPFALKGVTLARDAGLPRGAFVRDAASRVLQALKEAGANAIRFEGGATSAWRELCDETGFIVVDEKTFPGCAEWPRGVDPAGDGEGLADFALFPRPLFAACRAAWRDDAPTIRFLTDWNGVAGAQKRVAVASSGDETELFANGESAGRKRASGSDPAGRIVEWTVPFEAGELKAISYDGGVYMGESACKTAFGPAALKVSCSKKAVADGEFAFAEIALEDEYGVAAPEGEVEVELVLEGPGEIVSAANGAGLAALPQGNVARVALSRGRAVVAIRRAIGGSGLSLKLSAKAPSLRGAVLDLPRR